jgi:hypothetical protein
MFVLLQVPSAAEYEAPAFAAKAAMSVEFWALFAFGNGEGPAGSRDAR